MTSSWRSPRGSRHVYLHIHTDTSKPWIAKDLSLVTCPLLDPEDPTKRIEGRLPFIDPHEYLEYLWTTKRIQISDDDIE